jgi:hypothetical protein
MKARNFSPLPPPLLLAGVLPQLKNSKLTGRRKDNRIKDLFKPGTPGVCRIFTRM